MATTVIALKWSLLHPELVMRTKVKAIKRRSLTGHDSPVLRNYKPRPVCSRFLPPVEGVYRSAVRYVLGRRL